MPPHPARRRPRVRLVDDWRRVLKRAWSIRLLLLAGALSGLEVALPLLDGSDAVPRGLLPVLSALTTAGALVARLLAQKEIGHGEE